MYNHRYLLVEPLSRRITRAEFHLTQNRVNFSGNTMNVVRTLHSFGNSIKEEMTEIGPIL